MSQGIFSHSTPRALVVNDDTTQLNILCGLLRKAGLEPVPFKDAESALTSLQLPPPPALIVTDLYMPGIDGWRFCRLLRSPEYALFNQTPILVVSATFSGDEPARITADLGANAFLSMPVDGQRFIDRVQTILQGENVQQVLQVLIVENSQLVAKRLAETFQTHGYRADTALTFQEGQRKINQTSYDIAVLEYHLPDGLGDGLLQELQEKSPGCVCVLMTTDPQPDLALTWMKMGAAAYLQKPFEPAYLIALCERTRREHALLHVQDLLEVRTRQLRESEQRHRRLVEASGDMIFSLDRTGVFTMAGGTRLSQFGLKPKDVVGRSLYDLFPIDDATKYHEKQKKVFESGEVQSYEQTFEFAGLVKTDLVTVYPIKGESEQIELVGVICRDISERVQAELALRASEALYLDVVEGQTDPICRWLPDTTLTFVNSAYCSYFGKSKAEFVGTRFITWLPQETQQIIQNVIDQLLNHQKDTISAEEVNLDPHGQQRWMVWVYRPITDKNGKVVEFQSVGRDITERKHIEQALHASEERYQLIDEASQDMIYSYDRQGRFTHANSSLCRLLGVKSEHIIGKTHAELGFPPAQCAEWARLHQQVYDTHSTLTTETITPIQGGPPQYFEVVLNPIHDEVGNIIGIAGTTRDISARKAAEAKINEQLAELRRWHNITLGREDRILELKRELNQLLVEAGKPPRYTSVLTNNHE